MVFPATEGASAHSGSPAHEHFRELFWKTLARLAFLYFLPLLLLAVFFHLQYRNLVHNSLRAHLEVIAEHQANTFDLFLRERLVNLGNLIDDPRFETLALDRELPILMEELQSNSPAFVDLGVVDASGDLIHYTGPISYSETVNYRKEEWFQGLLDPGSSSVITEIYLGFRDQPHFTIAVRRGEGNQLRILRSALSPEQLSSYLATLEGASEVYAAIVNDEGVLQVATAAVGTALNPTGFVPPEEPARGFVEGRGVEEVPDYAYARLRETPWALVVTDASGGRGGSILAIPHTFVLVTLAVFLLAGIVILVRTRQVVGTQMAAQEHEAELSGQLVQAAKLASVGELAAGIAHEINNPLAVIAEEVGVLKDSLDPELAEEDEEPVDLQEHLDAIHEAVFRCRDITRKLLTFVRKTEVKVESQDLHEILDEVLDAILGNELAISNVTVERRYDRRISEIQTDRNQLIQVFVNLVKNALDAMPGGGRLTVTTASRGNRVAVAVQDTGGGMSPSHVERVFLPFFTTKDPGEGTGLGLSVSYTIIRDFGGHFYVESAVGKGSTFTVELPLTGDSALSSPRPLFVEGDRPSRKTPSSKDEPSST